jgi:hydrogenase expression/formation protein HypC
MCLAVPMQLQQADGAAGRASSGGVSLDVRLDLVEGATVGDWVLVHAGYAIAVLDEAEAAETLQLLRELDQAMAGDGS